MRPGWAWMVVVMVAIACNADTTHMDARVDAEMGGGGVGGVEELQVEELWDTLDADTAEATIALEDGLAEARERAESGDASGALSLIAELASLEPRLPGAAAEAAHELGMAHLFGYGAIAVDPSAAYDHFMEAAETGHPTAQAMVGVLKVLGLGTERDEAGAVVYWTFGSMGGSPVADMAMGMRHTHGWGVPKNCEAAVTYYEQASQYVVDTVLATGAEPVWTRDELSDDVELSQSADAEDEDIVWYYQLLADQGDAQAQVAMGQLHWQGAHGLDVDHNEARRFFQQAAAEGNPEAMANMGHLYVQGLGVEPNVTTALDWYRRGIEEGSTSAMNGLGFLYLHGDGVDQDLEEARRLFQEAADAGNPDAQLNLGSMMFNGQGGKRDYGRAIQLFMMAAHQKRSLATHYLAMMHLNGLGTTRSCLTANSLYKSVAERGVPNGLMKEAYNLYRDGAHDKALVRYLFLSVLGLERAQSNAAYLLGTGVAIGGGSRSALDTRLFLLAMSSRQGNTRSQLDLGDHFFSLDSEEGMTRALEQYRRAADRRNPQAMFNLGYLHQHGLGMERDFHLAKRYYDMAWETSPDAALAVVLARTGLWAHTSAVFVEEAFGCAWDTLLGAVLLVCITLLLFIRSLFPV